MIKDKNTKKNKPTQKGVKTADTLRNQSEQQVPSDVQGSYTGSPIDGGRPVQDADDL